VACGSGHPRNVKKTKPSIVNGTRADLRDVLRPIASLIAKSEKARQKLRPATWQHEMLGDNVRALRIASGLIRRTDSAAERVTRDNLRKALRSVGGMIGKTEEARTKFSSGTPQHTLQRNRLKALRVAKAAITAALDARSRTSR
jgi:hypothetical protein